MSAEIAPDCGGKPLDSPRLAVLADVHADRSVRSAVFIEVK
jgi:hypothetical protein